MDFKNPSEKMVKEANRRGLDLSDPKILNAIEDIQSRQENFQVANKWNGTKVYVALYVLVAGFFLKYFL